MKTRTILLPCALLALIQAASAQQPPSGGTLQQQIPPPPTLPRPPPEIRVQPRTAPPAPGAVETRIVVNRLQLQGATVYQEPELLAVTGFTPGNELSLTDLNVMAARITEHYRRNGYFVAQAYLPPQNIVGGNVTMVVSEGRLGRVQLNNQSRLSDRVANAQLAGLQSGEVITTGPLETRLLLLSDLPGVNVRSTLVPGAAVGTSDLVVDINDGRRVTGSIDADNGGNYYTGAYRLGATVNLNNPLGLGDVASVRLLTSGSGLQYGRASYQLQAGRGQVGIAYSHLNYELGKEFESLDAHGTAQIASVFGRYPVIRSRDNNLYLQLAFDAKRFDDRVDVIPARTEKKSRVLMASAFGDHRDNFFGGGVDSYFLTLSAGTLDIETPSALTLDQATARTNGGFRKLNFSAMRLQRLGSGPFSLYAGISGQLASKNLDVSEKMPLGGMYGVRAYPEGEAYGDQGYLFTVEARYDLPPLPEGVPGHVQLIAFADVGGVKLNKNPWTDGDNHRTLSGAGVGVNWGDPGNFLVRASYARKIGDEPAISSPDKSGRFWIQLVKYF